MSSYGHSIIILSSIHHQTIIKLSSIHHQTIIYPSSNYHLSIIKLSSIYHQTIINLSSDYHQSIINVVTFVGRFLLILRGYISEYILNVVTFVGRFLLILRGYISEYILNVVPFVGRFLLILRKYMLYNIKFAIAYVDEKQYLCSEIINHLNIAIMKQKLTKNDSMSKKCSQICERTFDITTDFDVIVAAFEATINAHGLWEEYFKWFRMMYLDCDTEEVYSLWKSWAKNHMPMMWSNQAFLWEATDVDFTRWHQIDKEWRYWLMLNVYKF